MKTAILFFAAVCAGAQVTLVREGKSEHRICVAADAAPGERWAAEELQRFVEEMAGARLAVETCAEGVGPRIALNGDARLGAEEFRLRTVGRDIIIEGGRPRGVMYGVYELLEKLGCRWYTAAVSKIPKRRTIRLGAMDESGKPAFEYRETFFTEAFDRNWSARNRVNGNTHQLDEATGGKVRYYPFVHSFYQMLPPEKHFKDHPEYFSLIGGKRRWERGQLCLTNPDVLRLGIEAVRGWIREHPEATILSVSQNDWTGWCECDNCRRVEEEEGGAHIGPVLRYVNALAAEIEKTNPDKLIDTLAYWYTERPPLKARPRANVRIRLCPIGACEAHPYEQCEYNRLFVDILKSWSKMTSRLYIWHYNTNFSHYLAPFPDFDELAADIPMYQRTGVVGLFLQGAYAPGGGGSDAELRSYVMARLLWNPRVNVEREIDDFLGAVYGKAARWMRSYFDLAHAQVRAKPRGKGHHMWIFDQPRQPYLNDEFLTKGLALMDRAEKAADSEETRERVRKARMPLEYVRYVRAKQFVIRDGRYGPVDAASLKRQMESVTAAARKYGIQQLHEGRTVEQHEKNFARRIRGYRAVTIENAAARATVVPELNGRVVELVDKRSGLNVLRTPDAGSWDYPDVGGAWVSIHPDYYGNAYSAEWDAQAERQGAAVALSAKTKNGLAVRRRIWLEGGSPRVNTVTEIENTGASPVAAALQAHADYSPKDGLEGAELAWRYETVAGARHDGVFFQAGQETTGTIVLEGEKLPRGAWTAYHPAAVPALTNHFAVEEAWRAVMRWSVRGGPMASMLVWSAEKQLAPGERLSLRADYEPVK
jgi:hypothetical protein